MSVRILLSANLNRDNYRQAVEGCGGIAIVEYLPDIDLSYDGLILCGGNDVDPSYYGQEINGAVEIDRLRDENEFALARGYIDAGKPVMGICRGYQLLNIFFGGTLHQHLSNASEHRKEDGGNAIHGIKAEKGSLVEQLYGEEFVVNSIHHQAVDRLGKGLWATAVSEDGTVIEAFEHKELPVFGVQWHPERMCFANKCEDTVDGTPVFEYFLKLCEKAKKKETFVK